MCLDWASKSLTELKVLIIYRVVPVDILLETRTHKPFEFVGPFNSCYTIDQ